MDDYDLYIVYAGERGFWSNGGTWVSKFTDAKGFTRQEAISFCQRRYNKATEDMPCVPVRVDDLRDATK
jgi:hypothetical protein